jgi:hypothetical protein
LRLLLTGKGKMLGSHYVQNDRGIFMPRCLCPLMKAANVDGLQFPCKCR